MGVERTEDFYQDKMGVALTEWHNIIINSQFSLFN